MFVELWPHTLRTHKEDMALFIGHAFGHKTNFHKSLRNQVAEMAQWTELLKNKCEDLRSDLQNPHKSGIVEQVCHPCIIQYSYSEMGAKPGESPSIHRSATVENTIANNEKNLSQTGWM